MESEREGGRKGRRRAEGREGEREEGGRKEGKEGERMWSTDSTTITGAS